MNDSIIVINITTALTNKILFGERAYLYELDKNGEFKEVTGFTSFWRQLIHSLFCCFYKNSTAKKNLLDNTITLLKKCKRLNERNISEINQRSSVDAKIIQLYTLLTAPPSPDLGQGMIPPAAMLTNGISPKASPSPTTTSTPTSQPHVVATPSPTPPATTPSQPIPLPPPVAQSQPLASPSSIPIATPTPSIPVLSTPPEKITTTVAPRLAELAAAIPSPAPASSPPPVSLSSTYVTAIAASTLSLPIAGEKPKAVGAPPVTATPSTSPTPARATVVPTPVTPALVLSKSTSAAALRLQQYDDEKNNHGARDTVYAERCLHDKVNGQWLLRFDAKLYQYVVSRKIDTGRYEHVPVGVNVLPITKDTYKESLMLAPGADIKQELALVEPMKGTPIDARNTVLQSYVNMVLKKGTDPVIVDIHKLQTGLYDEPHTRERAEAAQAVLKDVLYRGKSSEGLETASEKQGLSRIAKMRNIVASIGLKLRQMLANPTTKGDVIADFQKRVDNLENPTSDDVVHLEDGTSLFGFSGGWVGHTVGEEFRRRNVPSTEKLPYSFCFHNRGHKVEDERFHGRFSFKEGAHTYKKTTVEIRTTKEALRDPKFLQKIIETRYDKNPDALYDFLYQYFIVEKRGEIYKSDEEKDLDALALQLSVETSEINKEKIREKIRALIKKLSTTHTTQLYGTCADSNITALERDLASLKTRRAVRIHTAEGLGEKLKDWAHSGKFTVSKAEKDIADKALRYGAREVDYQKSKLGGRAFSREALVHEVTARTRDVSPPRAASILLSDIWGAAPLAPEVQIPSATTVAGRKARLQERDRVIREINSYSLYLSTSSKDFKISEKLKVLPEYLRNNELIWLAAIKTIKNLDEIKDIIPPSLLGNRKFVIRAFPLNFAIHDCITIPNWKEDEEIILAAMSGKGRKFDNVGGASAILNAFAGPSLKAKSASLLAKVGGSDPLNAYKANRDDRSLALQVVKKHPELLNPVYEIIKKELIDEKFWKDAAMLNMWVLRNLPKEFKYLMKDEKFLLDLLEKHKKTENAATFIIGTTHIVGIMDPSLKTREFFIKAFCRNPQLGLPKGGGVFDPDGPSSWKTDPVLAGIMVGHYGQQALDMVDPSVHSAEFIRNALIMDPSLILSPIVANYVDFNASSDFIQQAVNTHPNIYEVIAKNPRVLNTKFFEDFKNDKKLFLYLLKQGPAGIHIVLEAFQRFLMDKEFVLYLIKEKVSPFLSTDYFLEKIDMDEDVYQALMNS